MGKKVNFKRRDVVLTERCILLFVSNAAAYRRAV